MAHFQHIGNCRADDRLMITVKTIKKDGIDICFSNMSMRWHGTTNH